MKTTSCIRTLALGLALLLGLAAQGQGTATGVARIVDGFVVGITPPDNRASVLELALVPRLTIYGELGSTNLVEYVNAFGDTNHWITVTTVVLTSSPQVFYDTYSALGGGQRYYRAVVVGAGTRPVPPVGYVWLPPGRFTMGSLASEQDRAGDEGPQTVVTLSKGFYLSQHEVTQGEYLAVMGSNPASFQGELNRPVEQVSWNDATNYCGRLTEQERLAGRLPTGWGYRLPTEAEWEYAARAGTSTRFSFGDDVAYTKLGDYAWFASNSGSTTHPVATRRANRWGLFDMPGNVWEWCQDWYGAYPGGSVHDPAGAASGSARVFRGGGWLYDGGSCRAADRNGDPPGYRGHDIGFRPVLAQGL